MTGRPREERVRELLIERALGGLSPGDELELDGLARARDTEADSYELAAAAVHLALLSGELETLPPSLNRRLARSARSLIGRRGGPQGGMTVS